MATVRIEVNRKAVGELLRSEEVKADLYRRALAIVTAAGGRPDFDAEADVLANRAHARIWTATVDGMLAEAQTRALTRALDAGRA